MSATQQPEARGPIRSLVPARIDRLPWARFHTMVVLGLGTAWILDGLEVQIVAANGYAKTLGMDATQVGFGATVYLVGQVVGALVFGRLSDRLGRRKLFILTLFIYLIGTGVAGLSPDVTFFYVFRFIAGLGIGGEYAAINSAIDELIPSKYRGRVDIAINGTYWGGAGLGAALSILFLNPDVFAEDWGWRLSFFVGPVLGIIIIFLRRHIPESPRWLMTHGREEEAERTVSYIEKQVEEDDRLTLDPVPDEKAITVQATGSIPYRTIGAVLFRRYPRRSLVGFTMMITQSFLYNAIFFTYALVLENFYDVPTASVAYYFLPFALGNLAGPLLLGRLFDTWGRRRMIALTYGVSAVVLAVSAALFQADVLNATTHTVLWCVTFFFASAGASSAYLTVSEIFPLEIRAQVISYVFAIGQIAGAIAPTLYGALIGDGSDRGPLSAGYFIGAGIMAIGAVIPAVFGISAAQKSLEDLSDPLSLAEDPSGRARVTPEG
jgi:MFS family permease